MERLNGKPYAHLPNLMKMEARRQFQQQKRLIEDAGYNLVDCWYGHNCLFDPKKRKLYLFDLVRWEKR